MRQQKGQEVKKFQEIGRERRNKVRRMIERGKGEVEGWSYNLRAASFRSRVKRAYSFNNRVE